MYSHALPRSAATSPRDDIVTKLLNAEIDGDKLSETEFDMFFLLLAVAGQRDHPQRDTPRHARASSTNPDQFEKLKADPDRHMRRRDRGDPAVGHARAALPPHRDCGTTSSAATRSRQGDKVVMWHISANRDEAVFDDPYRFDIERRPTTTSRSAAAGRTSASAPTWPAWSCA